MEGHETIGDIEMQQKLLRCSGYEEALLGAMLSFGKTSFDNFKASKEDMGRIADTLAGKDGGHNKFLEQIQYWILIQAPLFWWKQFDTYRVGVSKSSESTMHKSWKRGLHITDFEGLVFLETINRLNELIVIYNEALKDGDKQCSVLKQDIISNLPDGYLQTRMVNVNAKCLRNIYAQRKCHELSQWRKFCVFIESLPHGGLITKGITNEIK
jgi:hypothetical protein